MLTFTWNLICVWNFFCYCCGLLGFNHLFYIFKTFLICKVKLSLVFLWIAHLSTFCWTFLKFPNQIGNVNWQAKVIWYRGFEPVCELRNWCFSSHLISVVLHILWLVLLIFAVEICWNFIIGYFTFHQLYSVFPCLIFLFLYFC